MLKYALATIMTFVLVMPVSALAYSNDDSDVAIAFNDQPAANLEVEDTTNAVESTDGGFVTWLKKRYADLMDEYQKLMDKRDTEKVQTGSNGTQDPAQTESETSL